MATKTVDSSLWWDPFADLLTEIETAFLSSDISPKLIKKLEDNRAWFLETVSRFKQPNEKSKEALNSQLLKVGDHHQLSIKPEWKEQALKISSYICLDEVQSYILVERYQQQHNLAFDSIVQDPIHVVLLQYYIERQCLLKCTRRILMHALYVDASLKGGNAVGKEALKLVSDGLEAKQISVLQALFSSTHPVEMDIGLFTLWAEETLIEDSLVLDILFLLYYGSYCTCNGERWKKLCSLYKGILAGSYNFGKLTISTEAVKLCCDAKIQLLLILIESLDLESLLKMVHDETPFSQGALVFSLHDVHEMDVLLSSLDDFEMKEAGPLILAWAVFLCLISSLPGIGENNLLSEIDHVGYVRQAFEAASLNYFSEILENDLLKESDGPAAGYRSVLRTFISAFVASYEINLQLEDVTLNVILDILCKIYRGEESLCIHFWDRESFIDRPIRCFLSNLEGEFPMRTVELIRFLSSLCEGSWPAECVYKFLDKSVSISTFVEISSESLIDDISQTVEAHLPVHVPGVEGLLIPSKTRGKILKLFNGTIALVRWEYNQSAVIVLLLRLAQGRYQESSVEALLVLDLFCRMMSFNMAIRFAVMDIGNSLYAQGALTGQVEKNAWVVQIICTLIRDSSHSSSAAMMARGLDILAKMFKCSPSLVAVVTLKANIFEAASRGGTFDSGGLSSSSGWLLSGKLAKMILIDCEQNDSDYPLTVSVLDFSMQLVETGVQNDLVLALVAFSLQYILVNHEYWKFKVKHDRWKVTLKVLQVMKTCIISTTSSANLGEVIRSMLLCDASIHNSLFRIICTTKEALEKLYIIRTFELAEIEGLELAIVSALDILYTMLAKFSMEMSSILPVFHQALLSPTITPVPVFAAVTSLISYFRNPDIQVGATRVLSLLLTISDYSQPYLSGNASFGLDDNQIADLRHSIGITLLSVECEDLFVASVNLLTSAAQYQPAFLIALLSRRESKDASQSNDSRITHPANEASLGSLGSNKSSIVDAILLHVERSDDLIKSDPCMLLNVLNFLKALWHGAGQYTNILESLKSSGKFWKRYSNFFALDASVRSPEHENITEMEAHNLAYRYQCQSALFEIMAHDIFLKQRLLQAESLVKQATESKGGTENVVNIGQSKSSTDWGPEDILSSWSESSLLVDLIKSYTSCTYDNEILFRAKVAVSLLAVHLIAKLATGDDGSLSVSLLEKVRSMSKKVWLSLFQELELTSHAAFSQLLMQYSQRCYSEGKELKTLILSDLYCHLQGELEGRKTSPGPFRELSQYLIESKFLQSYEDKYDGDLFSTIKDVYMFDPVRLRADLGLDMWDYSEWKASKEVAHTVLLCMQEANSMLLLAISKLSALKSLVTVLTVYENDVIDKRSRIRRKNPNELTLSCIDHICQNVHATVELLAPALDASKDILDFLDVQAELLLHLVRSVQEYLSSCICVVVLKTCGSGLKMLSDLRLSVTEVNVTIKKILMLLLTTMESTCLNSGQDGVKDKEHVEGIAEISNVSLGLLPLVCHSVTSAEHCTLSLNIIDLILRSLLAPRTWFPIIQQHLQLQHIIQKLQDKTSVGSIPIIFKFFLTLAQVRGCAEMLVKAGFFSSLKVLFSELLDGRPSDLLNNDKIPHSVLDKTEKLQQTWGLGLAVVAAMVHSLGDSFSTDITDSIIPFFFLEKSHLISYYLSAPDFPSDDHDKKRPRAQRTQTSLTFLKETENTLMLMCVLAKHWSSWVKAMKETDSQLRETSIHLLAFISRGTRRFGESASQTAPLLCPPILKEELDWYKKPSVVNSKSGWFALTPLSCVSKMSSAASVTTALVIRSQTTDRSHPVSQTYFSDAVAVQIYRITFLLLEFICLQAKGAAERAEEVGFVDLAHFPELPMPEILHGLQDQAVAIVIEVCEANKSKKMDPEICGIRPVLGRVEDFSKEVRLLIKATEGHSFLKVPMQSLESIIAIVYPGLL